MEGGERLFEDYDRDNILLYTPGRINLFLAEAVERIKEREDAKDKPWSLVDLGCCSSAVFAQSRLFYQLLSNAGDTSVLDTIMSVDGEAGAVRTAKLRLNEGNWMDELLKINMSSYSAEEVRSVYNILKGRPFRDNLEFKVADFTSGDLGMGHDVMVTSQCLQYNDQVNERDIEKIVQNMNSSLREGGHSLTVLTGNRRPPKSFTSESDVRSFLTILENYGFEVYNAVNIAGKKGRKTSVAPFHYVHAVKRDYAPGLVTVDEIPIMYSNTQTFLTGGSKETRFSKQLKGKEKKSYDAPDKYIDQNGDVFKF